MSNNDGTKLVFANETENNDDLTDSQPWNIVISDDEEEVHAVTKLVLGGVVFDNRPINFISAYTGEETIKIMQERDDIAVLIVDVVMEEDDSGLNVVDFIRNKIKNKMVRIILRTGQPGQAPEKEVISKYDINDYKEKTELTAQKLYTVITSSLRAYKDLDLLNENKKTLAHIVELSNKFYKTKQFDNFAEDTMSSLEDFFSNSNKKNEPEENGVFFGYQKNESLQKHLNLSEYELLYKNGIFDTKKTFVDIINSLPLDTIEDINNINVNRNVFKKNEIISFLSDESKYNAILYLKNNFDLTKTNDKLLKLLFNNLTIAFNNSLLNKEIIDTQKEIILTLGDVVETRSKEPAQHVKRVAEYSAVIAKHYGFDEEEIQLLKLASPMHDIGKVGILDSILNKPESLTKDEFEIMKNHTKIGHDILRTSKNRTLQLAAVIAYQHHERWDGKGYPQNLSKKEIDITSRITAIADVFDALTQKRIYKEPWTMEKTIQFVKAGRETQFDPELVDIMFDHFDEIEEIMENYPAK